MNIHQRPIMGVISLALLTAFLIGCSETKPPGGGGDGSEDGSSCGPKVEEAHKPVKIESGKHLHFNRDAFKSLSDKDFNVSAINLYVELEKKKSQYSVTVGMNGTVATRSNGSKDFDPDDGRFANHKRLRLDLYRLNGGEPLAVSILRLYTLSAKLKVSLQGTDISIKSATLVVSGYKSRPCPSPTPTPVPTPTPAPVAPSVNITKVSPPSGMTALTNLNVEFSSNQSGVTFLCSLDGAAEESCSSPYIRSNLGNGEHVFRVRARNAQGLISPQAAEHQWTVDAVRPVLNIQQPPSPTNKASISISFSSTKAGEFSCSLNGKPAESCSSPYTVTGLSEGLHSFSLSQTDAVGNVSLPAVVQWTVDLTPPETQIVATAPDTSPSSSLSREISFAADESSSFECSLNSAAFSPCSSPYRALNLSEGSHLFEVRATDNAGNVGPTASSSWITDLTEPVLSLSTVQPAAGNTNASDYSIGFTSSEPSTFFCRINGAEETECASPLKGPFSTDGAYSVEVVAQDLAGLRSAPRSVSWIVDRFAPDIHFAEILPSAAEFLSAEKVEFTIHTPEALELSAQLNGANLGVISSPLVLENLAERSYVFIVAGVDAYGNSTNSISHSFTIDRTAPVLSFEALYKDGQLTNRSSNNFSFSADESVEFECELNEGGYEPCQSPKDVSGLIDGEHIFRVRARDRAGNMSAVTEATWNVDATAPTTSLAAEKVSETQYKFSFTSNEADSSFRCSIDGASEFSCSSPYTAAFSVGSHSFTVHAIDRAGNRDPAGASYQIEVQEPITTSLSHANIVLTNQTSMSFSFTSNRANATFICSIDGGAALPCSSPMTVSGLGNGQHSFRVQAVGHDGIPDAVGASHSWTVDTTAPVILSTGNSTTSTTITVYWTLNESATGFLKWGPGFDTSRTSVEHSSATSHSIQLTGLSPNTLYSIQISGRDEAGNIYNGAVVQIRTRF